MFHRDPMPPISRRDSLRRMGAGFGALGLAGVLPPADLFADSLLTAAPPAYQLAPKTPHFAAKAKHVIQLFMPGGPSQVDTFDHKPAIRRYAGQRPKIVDRRSLRNTKNGLMPSPYKFYQHGQTGKWVSEIFPNVGELVDEICFVHSMHTDLPEHAGAIMMMNAGHLQPSRPSMGSWLLYGLGSENQDLPGFIAMSPRAQPRNKLGNWSNAFLPGAFTGTYVNIHEMKPDQVVDNLKNAWLSKTEQRRQVDLLARLNQIDLQRQQQDNQLEASIQAMEMAFRMQFAAPDAFDLSQENSDHSRFVRRQRVCERLFARPAFGRAGRSNDSALTFDRRLRHRMGYRPRQHR